MSADDPTMSALQVDAHQPTALHQTDAAVPRKRRKRAPAAGAAADCFTCSTRSLKCDRRRPYCSQCLDEGKDCSGYKTQLTWGVGVASRGKLRGLSLPIAGTQKLAGPTTPQKPKKRPSGSISQATLEEEKSSLPTSTLMSPDSTQGPTNFHFDRQVISPLPQSPYQTTSWTPQGLPQLSIPAAQNGIKVEPQDSSYSGHNTSLPLPSTHEMQSLGPVPKLSMNFAKHERASPMSHSASSPDPSYLGRTMANGRMVVPNSLSTYTMSPQFTSPFRHAFPDQGPFAMYPQPDESYVRNEVYEPPLRASFHPSTEHDFEPQRPETDEQDDKTIEVAARNDPDNECAISVDDMSVASAPTPWNYSLALSPFAAMAGIGKTPRMQYLINYYTEVISPVIVAFDGPNNPYRTHILRLAAESETLQHAISALSASNLRQRRETGALSTGKTDPARRSSMAHLSLTDESWHSAGLLSPQDQAREETFHKGYAIQSLNQQLAHPVLRKDDSILATLLILCLFHICDSGVAKFQTQFAGVKKLLSLRGTDLKINSPETKWFTRMFTWFDAMTASVNDREGQLQGHHLDVSALSDEEWALENLAGCDGQLFKTIALLGRLNVLSQGKAVEASPTVVSSPLPPMPFAGSDYSQFDGNGWMRIIADDDLFSAKSADPDVQTQFWREWREIRQTLQTWQLDASLFDSTSPEAPYLTAGQRLDLANISESFRYSALLYTERLASPAASSTDANIQAWVRQSLNFIKQVKSDVYLLWPLFITGSECVDELDRSIIRERCLDIQKDSGFLNNKSCLELLEKVWKANTAELVNGGRNDETRGFRFSKVMELEGNEGEYIVV